MIHFETLNRPPANLREAYLNGLEEPQELFLEVHVEAGSAWCLDDSAYAVVCGSKLVEFYVAPHEAHRAVEIFDAAMQASGASSVLAKSYDSQLLNFEPRTDVALRKETGADAQSILRFNDDFFESI